MKEKVSWFNEIPAKVFLAFSIIGIFYFYFDDLVLFKIGGDYEKYAYILFLFSVAITIINFFVIIWKRIKKWTSSIEDKKYYKEILANLDDHERIVLCEFYFQNRSTLSLKYDDPVIQGLVDKNVLINTSNIGGGILVNGFNMTYRINRYLKTLIDPQRDLDISNYPEFRARNM